MNLLIIAGVLVGILVLAGASVIALGNNDSPEKTVDCKTCGNKCTAESNCGSATCGAVNGGSCGCGK